MKLLAKLPHAWSETEDISIPLADGCCLAAKLWLPDIADTQPVPCIIEVLPYRKRDAYAVRDSSIHRYFAGHGYAAMRVDMRGSGDSDGHQEVFAFAEERKDTLEVIEWIARQRWSDGQVSMFGVSWGGLQGIHAAASGVPALKSVVAVAFANDHYVYGQVFHGGCLPLRAARWSAQVLGYKTRPPDPMVVGERWRSMWLERLQHNVPQLLTALLHPDRDDFWRSRAVAFADLRCPVFVAGGWADIAYVGSVGDALANARVPRQGLWGPWGHNYPHLGVPGPAIGFLQEALDWFDRWMRPLKLPAPPQAPHLRAWLSAGLPPQPFYPVAPGRWVQEDQWPSPRIVPRRYYLNPSSTLEAVGAEPLWLTVRSPMSTGLQCGELMPWFQHGPAAELPGDQQEDDEKSLCFDSAVLEENMDLLGRCTARLRLRSDRRAAFICVRLCDVRPSGESTRVTVGILNLCHRYGSHESVPLVPGETIEIDVAMVDCGYTFSKGHRIRIAVSTHYWPLIWPSASEVTLHLEAGRCTLELPVRPADANEGTEPAFAEPEAAVARPKLQLTPGGRTRQVLREAESGRLVLEVHDTAGRQRFEDLDLTIDALSVERYGLVEGDPLSATADIEWTWRFQRGDWEVRTEARQTVSCTRDEFIVEYSLKAYEGHALVHDTSRRHAIARHCL